MRMGRDKHVHDLRLAGHYTLTAGLPAALAGDVGQTVLLFVCDCGNGPDSISTKIVPGRWSDRDLDLALGRTRPRHATAA